MVSSGLNPPPAMLDLLFVAASLAFFVLCAAYIWFCDRVR